MAWDIISSGRSNTILIVDYYWTKEKSPPCIYNCSSLFENTGRAGGKCFPLSVNTLRAVCCWLTSWRLLLSLSSSLTSVAALPFLVPWRLSLSSLAFWRLLLPLHCLLTSVTVPLFLTYVAVPRSPLKIRYWPSLHPLFTVYTLLPFCFAKFSLSGQTPLTVFSIMSKMTVSSSLWT